MAELSNCATLFNELDSSCNKPASRFYQQAVLINKDDIDTMTITTQDYDTPTCNYKVVFALKTGKTGYLLKGPEAGSSFLGKYDKTRSDLGHAQYKHTAQVLVTGATEDSRCILDSLDKGLFVVAMQLTDGTVIIYGAVNGLTTGDYSYSIQEGGGGGVIALASLDTALEGLIPLVYESGTPGQENIDFNAKFAAA